MKYFLLFCFIFTLCYKEADAQTNAGIPDASTVLVVYNENSDTSIMIKNYYQNARGIPGSNIVRLQLPRREISVGDWSDPHVVKLGYSDEYIQDSTWAVWDSTHCVDTAKFHAWQYFLEEVVNPIRLHLQQNNLTSTIRYLVICRGVPYKIQSAGDWSVPGNISLDGVLAMLNTQNYDDFVEAIFNDYTSQCYSNSCDPEDDCYSLPFISNPYFDPDSYYEMNARFLPDFYNGSWSGYNYKLSYLVSRLDGLSYEIITDIIDRSIAADTSGEKTWIIDGGGAGSPDMLEAFNRLNSLGFTTEYNDDINNWITTSSDSVIGYTSAGVHQGMPPTYIQDTLDFNYANGAVFNTYESFNGYSIGMLRRVVQGEQGLMTEFLLTGGTGGSGNAWEPYLMKHIWTSVYFPSYAIGYNQIDAAWQGMNYLAWRSVIVGDPLTKILSPCEPIVLTSNTTIESGDYLCDIIVPVNVTLTIDLGSTVNFRRNAKLKVYGTLEIKTGAELNFSGYSMLIQGADSDLIIPQSVAVNFNDHSTFEINDNFIFEDGSPFSFGGSCNIIINGTAELSENSTFNLVNGMSCNVNGSFILNDGSTLNMQDNSSMTSNGKLKINSGSTLNINNTSKFFSYGELILNEGVILNLQYSSPGDFELRGVIKLLGIINNRITFNCLCEPGMIKFLEVDTLLIQHTEINSGYLVVVITNGIQKPRLLSISNSIVSNSPEMNFFYVHNTEGVDITLSDNSFSTGYPNYYGCLYFYGFNNVDIIRNTVHYTTDPLWSIGITSNNNKSLNINQCYINGFNTGIQRGYLIQEDLEDVELIYNEDIRIYNCTLNGGQNNNGTAISIGMVEDYQVSGVKIDLNEISDYKTGIQINNADNFSLGITNNSIIDYELIGISVLNGSEALIKENLISASVSEAEDCMSIYVSQVKNPSILGNTITAYNVSNPGPGMVLISSNGEIRRNTIQNHLYGIELGSASPKIGANTIINNKAYGIYISDNSNPDLTGSFVGDDQFPLSGYNTIRENGLCEETQNSELYLLNSLVRLEKGCNTIADDRDGVQQQCNNLYLVDGRKIPESIIQARANYWGNHPVYGNDPTGRFGEEVTIDYSDYFSEPCTYSQGEAELILANSKGEVYDTVYSTGNNANGLTDIESRYATANSYYYNNQYNQAKQEYEGIIQNYGNNNGSIQAYNRLYTIANLTNSSPSVFNQLKDYYLQKVANQTDSLMIGTLKHLSDLCLVSAAEYLPAINNFDEIAQQNPNTDIALYRQIDALTTALLLPQDSTLNKGILGKYSVSNLSDYTNKLSELLKSRGKSGLKSNEELIPIEFTLYQNYPNPFNPVTTIKYDLPNTSEVSLIIYDILGRKVKELVNTKQQAGRYDIQFNASNLASGVYIYQLVAEKYISSKKMILLK